MGHEALKRAIEWVGRQGQHDVESLEFAARQFDLGPAEEQLLYDQFSDHTAHPAANREQSKH